MSKNISLRKNILFGIFIGLLVVAGWMYYPDLISYFRFSAPKVKDKVSAMIRNQENRFRVDIENAAVVSDEKSEPSPPLVSKKDEVSEVDDQAPHKDVSNEGEAVKTTRPDYEGEQISEEPFDNTVAKPFWTFDNSGTAINFIASIKKSTGVDMFVKEDEYRYVVFIQDMDENGISGKEALINENAGIVAR